MGHVFRYLDTVGNGTGTKNANGNYASAAEEFFILPAAGDRMRIERMIISAGDTTGMQAEEYGNTGGALTNGITVFLDVDGVEQDLTDGVPVKTNAGWGQLCYDVGVKSWGAGDELLIVRWTFGKSGAPLELYNRTGIAAGTQPGRYPVGKTAAKLGVRLNDDLSGLLTHHFMVQGVTY